ncbi:hypothetical protein HYC85_031174 [Camellia sinensis]|uniref:Uncharacterized protein n=1 Tax=Camellia sinensis TaxID=4442 RepID=A0A7J7FQU8_CAMSI|nr:hypothetical protein HYC85_031174 [Camellia sinensis]
MCQFRTNWLGSSCSRYSVNPQMASESKSKSSNNTNTNKNTTKRKQRYFPFNTSVKKGSYPLRLECRDSSSPVMLYQSRYDLEEEMCNAQREAVEAAHQKCIQMPRIIHLREAAATGSNGERSGDHMDIPNPT